MDSCTCVLCVRVRLVCTFLYLSLLRSEVDVTGCNFRNLRRFDQGGGPTRICDDGSSEELSLRAVE